MHNVYLSRRNIQTLLNKLDRVKYDGGYSACTLIKCDNEHAKYPQSMVSCAVTAVESIGPAVPKPARLTGEQIYLSREDLVSLLTGLDAPKDQTIASGTMLTTSEVDVHALEDNEYYSTREPGYVLPVDDPK
jgi:hypothetical protein